MNTLVIGGTGIVGSALARKENNLTLVGIDNPFSLSNVVHPKNIPQKKWDVIIQLYTFSQYNLVEQFGKRPYYLTLSSTLVYDRRNFLYTPLSEDMPLSKKGPSGGYVDHKLEVEAYWRTQECEWTILRPYHIYGKNAALGCLPFHNRDEQLKEKILRCAPLFLVDGGRVPLQAICVDDLAEALISCIHKRPLRKAINVVHPVPFLARTYYEILAKKLGKDLVVTPLPAEEAWKKNEWPLTTLPHLYDTSRLQEIYTPSFSLEEGLEEGLSSAGKAQQTRRRMHLSPRPHTHFVFT